MNDLNKIAEPQVGKSHRQMGSFDLQIIISILKSNWYYLLISVIAAFIGAYLYINHTLPVFRSTVTIQVNETGERSFADNTELLMGLGLPAGMRNQANQIMVLQSRALTERALKELPFEIEYYFKTIKNSVSVFPEKPIRLLSDYDIPLPKDTEFSITYLGNNRFNLESESRNFPLKISAEFGEPIEVQGGSFRIECGDVSWFNKYKNNKLYFLIYSRVGLINYYKDRLIVELLARGGSIMGISIEGTNKSKDVEFLNQLASVYQGISLDKKNAEAYRRIQFIDDQLIGISDSLSATENRLQQFRQNNRVMDLSAQGQAIIEQVTLLENEKARLNLEANYYDYLADYLAKDISREVPIVPITMGITDPGLTNLVTELTQLQQQLMDKGAGEKNPLQGLITQRVNSTKEALLETLNGLRRRNSLARSDNQDQINKVNYQASALPVTERQLLGIERKFRLNDELYTYLLETRANLHMQKASNVADSEVIDTADEKFSSIVSPIPLKVYFVSLIAGLGIPVIIIFLNFLFSKKLKEEDIRRMTNLPVIAQIPRNAEKSNLVLFEAPNSSVSEAFRMLRTKLQFFTKDQSAPVILVTSAMPKDGKTFISVNLASVCSLLGKRTILVGFDLRKPKIYDDFNLGNERGVSTWLIGKDRLEDIVQKTSYENLFVITAGPTPPNPSELTASQRTEDLINALRKEYEYIIIDTSPISFISDTIHLAKMADACLLVVRPKKTYKDMLDITLNEIHANMINGTSILINDLISAGEQYGDKYGYTKEISRKNFKFRISK